MINKIYKRIHNKYSSLFKFIFFLRYVFGIFILSVALFLSIPHFLDYKKKDEIIKKLLFQDYGLQLINYDRIKYNSLPTPRLEILNATNFLNKDLAKLTTKKLVIYLELKNIYNFQNLKAKKIVLNENITSLKTNELQILKKYFDLIKHKIKFKNLELKILREDKSLINLRRINFSNYGHSKNLINGEVFDRKFKVKLDNNFNKINFKLLNTGIIIDLNLDEINEKALARGTLKAKILNSNLKFNFEYNDETFKIYDSYFRSKVLSFYNKSVITLQPFLSIGSNYNIEDIDLELFQNLDFNKVLNSKVLIKKFNSENFIQYKSKIFDKTIIDNLDLKINFAYGRLFYSTNIFASGNSINCEGKSNLLEEYPILYFNCSINSKDKKNLLNKFSINYKKKNELLNLDVEGYLNFLKNNINFTSIQINKNYKASKEDLSYFKDVFKIIFLNKNLFGIFNKNNIREFILEVY